MDSLLHQTIFGAFGCASNIPPSYLQLVPHPGVVAPPIAFRCCQPPGIMSEGGGHHEDIRILMVLISNPCPNNAHR